MEDKRIYLIALFDEGTNNELAGIYNKLVQAGLVGEQTKDIPYHFTLGSFDSRCEALVLERAQAVAVRTKAFDINLNHIGLFGLRVLFLAPSLNIELLQLYNDSVPDEAITGYHNWVAHATLLIDSPHNIQTAVPLVAQLFSPRAARIESIGVVESPPLKFIAEYKLAP